MMRLIKRALAPFGLELTTAAQRANAALGRAGRSAGCRRAIVDRGAPFTMTSLERRAGFIGVCCEAGLDDVGANLASTGDPAERLHRVDYTARLLVKHQSP